MIDITMILQGLIVLLVGLAAFKLWPIIKASVPAIVLDIIRLVARFAVYSVEASFGSGGGEEKFKIQKEHDKRKRDYAKKHGYKLITIKYTYDTYESIEEYLDKELKQLGVIDDTRKEENVNDAA